MIRSTCAALFAVVVATVLVTSPQSTEAKDRRCRSYCCPQSACCQPQAACCQPVPTCCQPRSACCHVPPVCCFDSYSVCPNWKWATWYDDNQNELYCSYYATRCDTSFPENLDTVCDATLTGCPNDPSCITINQMRTSSLRGPGSFGHSHKPGTKLSTKIHHGKKPKLHPNGNYEAEFVGQNENQPTVAKFITKPGSSEPNAICYFQLRLYRLWEKNRSGQRIRIIGEYGVGQECTDPNSAQLPTLIEGREVQVIDPNVAIVTLGATQYQVVTKTALR